MNQLEGRVALITGAKGGLGSYVTQAFLDAGATVAGTSRSIQQADFDSPRFHAFPAELSSFDAARSLVAEVTAKLQRIDVLLHLMGGWAGGRPLQDTDDATFERMLDMNLRSTFHIVRAALPNLGEGGRILAIGSKAAVEPQKNSAVYNASKAAVVSLIRTVALENKHIAANVVLPGTMDTPANRGAMPKADFSKWVQPEQVAQLLVYLSGANSSQLTGAVIPIYGSDL